MCLHSVDLAQILEQDLPAGVPLVLMVSEIRSRATGSSSSKQPGAQQQPGGASHAAGGPAAGDAVDEVLGIQLSDGWYYVNAMVDGPITDLINSGRLQVCGDRGDLCKTARPAATNAEVVWAMHNILLVGRRGAGQQGVVFSHG